MKKYRVTGGSQGYQHFVITTVIILGYLKYGGSFYELGGFLVSPQFLQIVLNPYKSLKVHIMRHKVCAAQKVF